MPVHTLTTENVTCDNTVTLGDLRDALRRLAVTPGEAFDAVVTVLAEHSDPPTFDSVLIACPVEDIDIDVEWSSRHAGEWTCPVCQYRHDITEDAEDSEDSDAYDRHHDR